jgi:hypothetical protein
MRVMAGSMSPAVTHAALKASWGSSVVVLVSCLQVYAATGARASCSAQWRRVLAGPTRRRRETRFGGAERGLALNERDSNDGCADGLHGREQMALTRY